VLPRDVRPANILIDQHGAVCITDFAIGIPTDNQSERAARDALVYLAPEQRSPGRPLSERTDLYAVGVVLYELLVGEPPARSASKSVPLPSQRVGEVDSRLENAIVEATSCDTRLRTRPAVRGGMPRGSRSQAPSARRLATKSVDRRRSDRDGDWRARRYLLSAAAACGRGDWSWQDRPR